MFNRAGGKKSRGVKGFRKDGGPKRVLIRIIGGENWYTSQEGLSRKGGLQKGTVILWIDVKGLGKKRRRNSKTN